VRQIAGVAGDQMFVQHLTCGVGEVGHLQQQEAAKEVAVDTVPTNHACTQYGNQCGHEGPWIEASIESVFDQGYVQWREDSEEQDFRHRQHPEAQVQAYIGDAKLQSTDDQHPAHEARLHTTPLGQRDEDQPGQHDADQHSEVAVDMPCQKNTDQAE